MEERQCAASASGKTGQSCPNVPDSHNWRPNWTNASTSYVLMRTLGCHHDGFLSYTGLFVDTEANERLLQLPAR